MSIEWAVAALLILPALCLSAQNSPALVDYAILVYAFNREIRRVVDWYQGAFNPFSPISLTPLLIIALLLAPFLSRLRRLHAIPKQAFFLLFVAIGYGTFVGLARNGFAAIYATAEYLSPVALMGYAAVSQADERTSDRWLKTAGWATLAACAYGWYQYLTIPPWDAFWVQSVGFVGYLGKLAPTEMCVFSTFGERGICAAFLALSAIPMLVSRRWRLLLGWPEGLFILSVILLTLVRTGIILVGLGVILYPMLNRGKGAARLALALASLGAAAAFGFDHLPGAERINDRFSTLQNMREDASYQGRLGIAQYGAQMALSNPVGFGIGFAGLGGRLNGKSGDATGAIAVDNGYIEVLSSLGVPGMFCLTVALVMLWRYLTMCTRYGLRDDYFALARGFFVVFLIGMMVTNFFNGLTVMWIALGRALSPMMLHKLQMAPEYDSPELLAEGLHPQRIP
ncbi:MAG: O-antigen ligase family protein [Verrucomicrobia bacterium]|nr:O-antigen ligase family protein [Verrucomicrobiota bacterium]